MGERLAVSRKVCGRGDPELVAKGWSRCAVRQLGRGSVVARVGRQA